MTMDVIILKLMLPLGTFLLSMGAGLLTAAISLNYKAKALRLECSDSKKDLATEIEHTTYWLIAALVIAFGIGFTFLWFYMTSLLPVPAT